MKWLCMAKAEGEALKEVEVTVETDFLKGVEMAGKTEELTGVEVLAEVLNEVDNFKCKY